MTPEPAHPPRPELSRPVAVDRLPPSVVVEAGPAECAAIAARLQIPAVLSLTCRFSLRRRGTAVLADGTLSARLVQECVVSLEPLEQSVEQVFDLRFVPAGTERDTIDPDGPDELPFEGNQIDLGEAAVEQLALEMDPYPRSPPTDPTNPP